MEELVKRLRNDATAFVGFVGEDLLQAADTIEKLGGWWAQADKLIKMLEMPRWIPVTERLPDEDGKYLCTVRSFSHYNSRQYSFVDILIFQDGRFFEFGTERVTHWMPLPKLPEEGQA